MGCCTTFFAIVKAYTTLNIFALPIGFKCGGWLFSPIVLIVALFFELICAIKLVDCANKLKIYSYPDIVMYTLGNTYFGFYSTVQAFLNFVFTIGSFAFFMKSLCSFVTACTGEEQNKVIYLIATIVIFAPILWVRTIETFQVGYVFAVGIIMILLIISVTLVLMGLSDKEWEAGDGWTAFNSNQFITMWGLSFFMFEGVGSLMPVLEASEYKENFNVLLASALITLCTVHISFSELCYYYFGDGLQEPIVTEQLPQDNWFLISGKLLYCVNILFSIPLVIYITNEIIEGFVFQKMRYSTLRTWLKNLSRTLILTLSALIAFFWYYQLHKILSFVGVVFGSFIVIITPTIIHYKVIADSQCSKVSDILIIIYAVSAAISIGALVIYDWNGELSKHNE